MQTGKEATVTAHDDSSDTRLHRQIGRLVHRVITRWMASQIGCHRNRLDQKVPARPGITDWKGI